MTPLYSCQAQIPEGHNLPAAPTAFLDRDGVINIDRGYVSRREDFEWVTGIKQAIARLRELGYRIVIVTNQSGVGRGYYTESDFLKLMEWVLSEIEVDATFYCACSPESNCPWRKPETGMLEAANQIHTVDKPRSFLIGDKDSDMEAAERFGIKSLRFDGGDIAKFIAEGESNQLI